MDNSSYPAVVGHLEPCCFCGRTFNPESLQKHQKVCQKRASKPKVVFDSSKQRTIAEAPKKLFRSTDREAKATKSNQPSKSSWRQKHQEFIQTIRAARQGTQAPPSTNDDYEQCPYCNRRFNESAAKRHIQFCADQHKRLENKAKTRTTEKTNAARKQELRTGYRAPLPSSGKRRSNEYSRTDQNGFSGVGYKAKSTWSPNLRSSPQVSQNASQIRAQNQNREMNFDTSTTHSGSARTRTGLKAASKSSSATESDSSLGSYGASGGNTKRKISNMSSQTRRPNGVSYATGLYSDGRSAGSHFDLDEHPVKQPASHKATNARTRQHLSNYSNAFLENGDSNVFGYTRPGYDGPVYEDSLTDFVSREFGSHGRRREDSDVSERSILDRQTIQHQAQGDRGILSGTDNLQFATGSKFCHECGSKYPVLTAKFCCECGVRRIVM